MNPPAIFAMSLYNLVSGSHLTEFVNNHACSNLHGSEKYKLDIPGECLVNDPRGEPLKYIGLYDVWKEKYLLKWDFLMLRTQYGHLCFRLFWKYYFPENVHTCADKYLVFVSEDASSLVHHALHKRLVFEFQLLQQRATTIENCRKGRVLKLK